MNTARQTLTAAVNNALAQPGAKWTPETGWTDEPRERPTLDAFLSSLAGEYRRAFDLAVPECLSLAVSAFVRDVRRSTGGRISERAAEGLLLGL